MDISYSNLLSAGANRPLSQIFLDARFTDISLQNIVQIASGYNSILAVTKQGEVHGRGANTNGELALGDTKARSSWTKITGFPCAIKQVSLNCMHSLFLTEDGQVYSCGNNEDGQLVCIF